MSADAYMRVSVDFIRMACGAALSRQQGFGRYGRQTSGPSSQLRARCVFIYIAREAGRGKHARREADDGRWGLIMRE